MIKILERYITKTLVMTTLVVALIITAVLFLITMLGELKNMGVGDYGLLQATFYVFLRLPNQLYQFTPLLILLGSIAGLSVLSSHRELAVMRASGFSVRHIILNVLGAALLMILVVSLLGEGVGPSLSTKAATQKEFAQNAGQAVVTSSGSWLHVGNNFIHIQQVMDRERLQGVTRYEFDDEHHLQAAYYAKTLTFNQNQWQMNDVVKTSFYPDRTKTEAIANAPWNLRMNLNLLNITLDPNDMTLSRLSKYIHYLRQNGLQSSQYQFDFWKRIFQPLASLVMIFLAIPFVLGTLRASTLGWRLLVGILAGFAFFILDELLGQLSVVYQIPTLFAALLPTVLFAIFGLFLSKRLIRR